MNFATFFFATAIAGTNTWLASWDTPHGMPPYDKLEVGQYVDAVKEAVCRQRVAIERIASNPAEPTFDNTVRAYADARLELLRITKAFGQLLTLERTDKLLAAQNAAGKIVSDNTSCIYFNKALFERFKKLHENSAKLDLTEEERRLLKLEYDAFVREGVGLDADKKEELRSINRQIADLSLKYTQNILNEANAFKERFGIDVSAYFSEIAKEEDRARREAMYKAYVNRGFNPGANDNRQLFVDIMKLRIKKAKLLGFETPAHYYNSSRMQRNPDEVLQFLTPILKAANEAVKRDIAELQKVMDKDIAEGKLPKGSKIKGWDCAYYSGRLLKEKFNYSIEDVKPYFKLENVLKGVFAAANALYGISFEEAPEVFTYNPKATSAYKVKDANGDHLGVFIVDYRPRPTKVAGAWNSTVQPQMIDAQGKDIRPIVLNACNFGDYLTPKQAKTAFHEFGHALHCLFSKCRFAMMSGSVGTSDYVEIFSQFNERYALHESILKQYAFDEKTHETIPSHYIEKIIASQKHMSGLETSKIAYSAYVDMRLHLLQDAEGLDIEKFERDVCTEMGMGDILLLYHRLGHFKHIVGNMYQAGFYSYLWAEVLEGQIYSIFEESGDIFNRELSTKFRKTFLERGSGGDPMELFRSFTGGKDPDPDAFFRSRGLIIR